MLYLLAIALITALCDSKGIKRAVPQKLRNVHHEPETRIVNGLPTKNSKYPWIVSLRIVGIDNDGEYQDLDQEHFCGGSIIDMGSVPIVLTAAHCVDGMQQELNDLDEYFKSETGNDWDFQIYADIGRTSIKSYDQTGPYDRIEVSNWYQHQDYDSQDVVNDIAIIALVDSIDTSDAPNATTVTYDVSTTLSDGDMLRVIGYGLNISSDISNGAGYTPTLEYTNISYINASLCNQYQNLAMYLVENSSTWDPILAYNWSDPDFSVLDDWNGYSQIIQDGMICGFDIDSDSCQGDSGGPVINMPFTADGTQVGVVSWGIGCAWGVPGVYSSVDYYLDWIDGAVSCLQCTEDSDYSNETSNGKEDSLSFCEKNINECKKWVKKYGQPVSRYNSTDSSGSSNNNNSSDVIIIVVVILAVALLCGVIVCVGAYVRRRRKEEQGDSYSSLRENEMTHGHSHSHSHGHHGHHHH